MARGLALAMFGFGAVGGADAAIDVNKSFSPGTVYPTEISRLTVSFQNSSLSPVTAAQLSDVFPDHVFAAAAPNATTTCGGTVSTNNTAARGELTLTGGTIPAGDGTNPGTCTVSVDVLSDLKGTYVNQIDIGGVSGLDGGLSVSNTQAAKGTLAVILQDVTVAISTDLDGGGTSSTVQGGDRAPMHVTISNPNPVPLDSASLLVDLATYAGNIRAVPGTATTTCGSGTVSETVVGTGSATSYPSTRVQLTGGTLPASSTCEITFDIEPTTYPAQPSNDNKTMTIPVGAVTTSQGASNIATATHGIVTYTGIGLRKTFNGGPTTAINLNESPTVTLEIRITNTNALAVSNIDLTDVMPVITGGAMTVDSIDSNNCGGTATTDGTQILLSGGTLTGGALNAPGPQFGFCAITATVRINAAGTYTNSIPAGTINGFIHYGTSATLSVSDRLLEVSQAISNSGNWIQGNENLLTISLNNPTGLTISNIDLAENVATIGSGVRIAGTGIGTNTCGGTNDVTADATSFNLANVTLAAGASCTFSVYLISQADIYPIGNRTISIPVGGITFDTPTNPGQTYPQVVSAVTKMTPAITITKSFTPSTVGANGVSRLKIDIARLAYGSRSSTDMALTDTLPAGHVIAADPNVVNGCGGTLAAAPGATSIVLSGGILPYTGYTSRCQIYVNVKAPAITNGSSSQSATNTIPGDAHGSPVNFSALDTVQPSPYNQLENYTAANATLTRIQTQLTVNKQFTPTTVNGGGPSRVRITFSNLDATAINLTGVGLTDAFTGTDLRLYSNVNPTFTDTAGVPNSNGCRGGTFTGNPGDTAITLANAQIDKAATCYFEFNVTGYKGGNHINRILVGDVVSAEGVTNPSEVAATLTVGRQINLGKGFSPSTIAAGETSTLTVDLFNTNVAPNDETGASPAFIDTLPAGLTITGTPSTTCAGGIVTTGTSGGSATLQLSGGTIPAEGGCKVTAQVTASVTGTYTNTLPIGALTTLSGATNPDAAIATLNVVEPARIAKVFTTTSIAQDGRTTIRFTLTNPNAASLLPGGMTGLAFSDTLTDMTVSAPLSVTGTCTGYRHDAAVGGASVTFSDISLLPSSSCYIDLQVTSNVLGTHPNQASGVSSDQTIAAGSPSNTANLTVLAPVTMTKAFASSTTLTDTPVRMTFTLTNPNAVTVSIPSTAFTDTFPAAPGQMVVASPVNLTNTCGSAVRNPANSANLAAGDVGVYVRIGSVPASGSCTIAFDVTVPAAGAYTNTTSTLSTSGGVAPAASAALTATASSAITFAKAEGIHTDVDSSGGDSAGDTVAYVFTIAAPSSNAAALTAVKVIDDRIGTVTVSAPDSGDTNGNGQLDPGETWIATAAYTLVQADLDSGSVTNTAHAEGASGASTIQSGEGSVTVSLTASPALSIAKTYVFVTDANGDGKAGVGDVIRYSYAVTNTGNITMQAVSVSDTTNGNDPAFLSGANPGHPVSVSLTGDAGASTGDSTDADNAGPTWDTLAPGDTITFTADYLVHQADVDTLQ
ncbi:beta strand repeat-containing protein [Zhengella mangrovi]|uniref:beta strand repeat-containing protein n=1 Tax=Zhengella mangrovi TaxID=1982044 RepID=UPI0013FDD6CF|nr:hypothetical protein [Zhengella mangrovi]